VSETDLILKEQRMNRLLLVTAASATAFIASAPPAAAADMTGSAFSSSRSSHSRELVGNVRIHRGSGSTRDFGCGGRDRDRNHDGFDGDHRDRGRSRDCVVGGGGSLGYLDYGDYDANRSFDPDMWNDWWHERPYRAYPRWVQENQNCTPDRMWWSGTGWHC
jgi:hypothetical protein